MTNRLPELPESPLQPLRHPLLKKHAVTLQVKRDDLIHPLISGNKWRKLKYNLIEIQDSSKAGLLTFGGAFSNHIYACAAAGKLFGIKTHAIIRGPELDQNNPTLRFARACGMQLTLVDRQTYRKRYDIDYLAELREKHPHRHIVPEGGTNEHALVGCQELAASLPPCDYVFCATGSGGTLAGLAAGLPDGTLVTGIAVLKQADYLRQEIANLLSAYPDHAPWQLLTKFHGGGYGRFTPELWRFCQTMRAEHGLPLEPVYTGKMLYAVWQLIEQGYFPSGSRIIAVHTGGLQGLTGLRYRGLI